MHEFLAGSSQEKNAKVFSLWEILIFDIKKGIQLKAIFFLTLGGVQLDSGQCV